MGLFRNLFRKRDTQPKTTTRERIEEKSSYGGVQVSADHSSCCHAAKAIQGERFLSKNAPMLPLADCDATDCRCTYRRFGDRRTDSRRASDVVFDVISQFHKDDHRNGQSAGRRNND